jgi:hypothetical protein
MGIILGSVIAIPSSRNFRVARSERSPTLERSSARSWHRQARNAPGSAIGERTDANATFRTMPPRVGRDRVSSTNSPCVGERLYQRAPGIVRRQEPHAPVPSKPTAHPPRHDSLQTDDQRPTRIIRQPADRASHIALARLHCSKDPRTRTLRRCPAQIEAIRPTVDNTPCNVRHIAPGLGGAPCRASAGRDSAACGKARKRQRRCRTDAR